MSDGSHRLKGYAMVGGTAVMFGATGVWVGMTDLPASTVLCMRMSLAAVMVALLGGAARWARQSRRPGVWPRLLALGLESGRRQGKRIIALTSEVPRFRFGSPKSVEPYFSAGREIVETNRKVLLGHA